jgi:esterase/lipase superfamily enzyme
MNVELPHFVSEIEKIRLRALKREWTWPPERDAQIVFRTNTEPQDININSWANLLYYIASRHKIPMYVSGGGYGCFALAAGCKIDHVTHLTKALESDEGLHSSLEGVVDFLELWTYGPEKTEFDIVAPQETYDLFVATDRRSFEALSSDSFEALSSDSFSEVAAPPATAPGKIILGTIRLWVYDPRTSSKSPGIVKRIWRRLKRGVQSLNSYEISHSTLRIVDLAKIHDVVRPAALKATQDSKFGIFVHGYATTAEDAIQSYGRLVHNIRCNQIAMTPIIFSWPSAGSAFRYTSDISKAEGSEEALNELLGVLAGKKRPKANIDILAHSHGAKLTVRSLSSSSCQLQAHNGKAPLRNVILVAPDVDNDFFHNKFPWVRDKAKRITVYHSKGDLALWASALFQTPRIGQTPILTNSNRREMDLIDASHLRADVRGHSYHTECPELHEDIRGIFEDVEPANRRLLQRDPKNPRAWRIKPIR